MAFEQKDMTGAMFPNRRKESDRHPDMTGDATIHGKLVWVNAWRKRDKNGNEFFSFAFKDKQPKPEVNPPTVERDELDREIPF